MISSVYLAKFEISIALRNGLTKEDIINYLQKIPNHYWEISEKLSLSGSLLISTLILTSEINTKELVKEVWMKFAEKNVTKLSKKFPSALIHSQYSEEHKVVQKPISQKMYFNGEITEQ